MMTDLELKKKTLGEKIKSVLEQQGKNVEKDVESVEKFLATLPSEHVDNLMEKMEELEGENVDETLTTNTNDYKNPQHAAVITHIRDALRDGDLEDATNLAQSLHVITE